MNVLDTYLQAACEAAIVGAAELERWRTKFSAREKAHADLVSEADLASQEAIRGHLLGRFPDHRLLGEEDPGAKEIDSLNPSDPPTWIVDPLDGTANYVHDVPAYCVSIGLAVAGELVVGVIHDPRIGETFSARLGGGATLNGRPIHVSGTTQLRSALMGTGFPPDPKAQQRNMYWWRFFSQHAQALRRTGSTALNLAYVSAGRFDAYWAFDNFAWDVAAGIVLVREAGGVVTRADGSPCNPFRPDMTAANPTLHAELQRAMRENAPTG